MMQRRSRLATAVSAAGGGQVTERVDPAGRVTNLLTCAINTSQ